MDKDPEIVKLPDAILADMERRRRELQAFNVAIDWVVEGIIKDLIAKPNFRDLPFYESEIKEKFLNTETPFFRAFNVIFALVLNRSSFSSEQVALLSRLVDQKQLGTAEQPWNDKRFANRLNTDQSITPAVRYILRLQAALLRNLKTANEFSIVEFSRVLQTFKIPALQGKAEFALFRQQFSNAVKDTVHERPDVDPSRRSEVEAILREGEFIGVVLDDDNKTWKGLWRGKHPKEGTWHQALEGIQPLEDRVFIEARRSLRQKASRR